MLQLKSKVTRRKALSLLEEKVQSILTEEGYVSKSETSVGTEITPDMLEDEDEEEEFVVDGEFEEGDVQIKPVYKKAVPQVSFFSLIKCYDFILSSLFSIWLDISLSFC